jgi:DNA polymerase III subunit gamma/tau
MPFGGHVRVSQYQVLARRWRPLTFEAVVGQEPIVRTLRNALARQRIAHAYLFTGPRGVGKTTTARLLAMGLSCERAGAAGPGGPGPCSVCEPCREIAAGRALDVIEIDGASNRGIDEVRTLRENARYAPARGRRKVYIIDEVHMLTEPAFNALLKTLEEPPAHVVFVLATTEPRDLPATILSRCQRFDFRPIPAAAIAGGLRRILDEETARGTPSTVEADALTLIARAADGSLRDALSLLDTALAYGEGRVTADAVRELLGSGGEEAAWGLAEALVRRDAAGALGRIDRAAGEGHDLGLLGQDALELIRRGLLTVTVGVPPADATPEEAARLTQLAAGGPEDLLLLLKGLVDAEAEMRKSPHPRVDLEVAAVRLCQRPDAQAIESLLERLERAEARIRGQAPVAVEAPRQGDLLGAGEPAVPSARPASAPVEPPPAVRPAPPRPATTPPPPRAGSPAGPDRRPGSSAPAAPTGGEGVWPRIVDELTRVRPMLGHKLSEAVLLADEGSRLVVSVPNGDPFTQDMLKQYRQQVLDVARRVRPDVREVQFTGASAAPAEPGGAVTSHPIVQAAVELFNGEVTDVHPAKPTTPSSASGSTAGGSSKSGEVT